MAEAHRLTREQARRVAVRAQLLDAERPTSMEQVLQRLTLLQDDPCAAVVPSAHLVLWSRLGATYDQRELEQAVGTGQVVELHQMLRPAADLALHRAGMANWPAVFDTYREVHDTLAAWMAANDDTRREILDKLHDEGPVTSRALPDTTAVPWRSSGWNGDRNVRMLLENMVGKGEVAVAGRGGTAGRDKLWDLAERVYPDDPVPSLEDAVRELDRRRLAGLGIARPKAAVVPGEPTSVGDAGEEAVVEGVRGRWRVDPAYLEDLDTFQGRVAVISPIDRLVIDRKRMDELFEFDYQLEMFKPAAKRRWGYWAMPVLVGDRLLGKVDATAERDRGVLRVDAIHEDEPWSAATRRVVRTEVEALARWLDLVPELPVTR